MYISTSMTDATGFKASFKDATIYEQRDGEYADYPDPSAVWFQIQSGIDSINLRLTADQLDAIATAACQSVQHMRRK